MRWPMVDGFVGAELGVSAPPPTIKTWTALSETASWLSVSEDGRAWSLPLPAEGRVSIGRANESDVLLRGPLISRTHALLHLGGSLQIEDRNSANGTTVAGRRLPCGGAVPIRVGDTIMVGTAALVVHGRGLPAARLRHQVALDEIVARLPALAVEHGGVTVARVRISGDLHPQWAAALIGDVLPEAALVSWPVRTVCALAVGAGNEHEGGHILRRVRERLLPWTGPTSLECFHLPGSLTLSECARAVEFLRGQAARGTSTAMIVRDAAMLRLYDIVDRVAAGNISVLILGETGVGKELVAAAIHERSVRRNRLFLPLNCAVLSETLLESDLFGHEAGAFTGARSSKEGLFERANQGTIFLDEIGELPLSVQAKLLRVLETGTLMRVGGLRPRPIDVRFVAATNRNLAEAVRRGTFREDLLFRLNAVTLEVPALRARPSEIVPLAEAFVIAAATRLARQAPRLHADTRAKLQAYTWPGNVRELKNVIERAVLLCAAGEILPEDLPDDTASLSVSPRGVSLPRPGAPAARPANDDERSAIVAALAACAGNQTRAASLLEISRRTLTRHLKRLAIPGPRVSRTARQTEADGSRGSA